MAARHHHQQPAHPAARAPAPRQPPKAPAHTTVLAEEETFEETCERERAADYLASTELLMWLANSRNESVPQTRHHFERVMAGFRAGEPDTAVEWEDVYEPSLSDVERLTPRSGSAKMAARAKSSGASTPSVAGPGRADGGGGGGDVGKKRRSGEGGQLRRKSGTGV